MFELLSPRQLEATGLFNPAAVAQLTHKVERGLALGETDDMALVGIVSTQLLHHEFISKRRATYPLGRDEVRVTLCAPPASLGKTVSAAAQAV